MKSLRALIGKKNISNVVNLTDINWYVLWPCSSICQNRLEKKGYKLTRLIGGPVVFLMTIDDLKSVRKMLEYEGLRYDLLRSNFSDREKLEKIIKNLNNWEDLQRHFDYLGVNSIGKVI